MHIYSSGVRAGNPQGLNLIVTKTINYFNHTLLVLVISYLYIV